MQRHLLLLVAFTLIPTFHLISAPLNYEGDVTDIKVLRTVDKHPDSWRIWQPTIIKWKKNQLVVAYGAMTNGKKDMGDIFAMVSRTDGDTWDEPVAIFDHGVSERPVHDR